ncbi:HAD family hydrolase [Streptomonospora arabica]|uniref:HAD family hydrolase n=1 Tax=Streptomonospora arabica TaxID=412417 RepID=A0ABV9SPR3_9ACTN
MNEAAIFDLDGTLVDSPAAITEITGTILGEMGAECTPEEIRATVGKPLDQNLARLMRLPPGHPDIDTATALYRERFGAYVRKHAAALLYPGVAEGLGKLRANGVLTAVATSKTLDGARKTVRLTGIAESFDVLVGHDLVAEGKPAPDMAVHAAELLGVEPQRCTVVGDTAGDIRMGRQAGMRTIAVTYGVGGRDELASAGAGACVDSFAEVVASVLVTA